MKRIILLSDGTGNSSAKLFKTNVWRMYQSLNLETEAVQQIACYNDGVGTSAFKPVALLGGAFGYGLKRNVLHLYEFICQHWEQGDEIYIFGFSRGAFTARILAGLVCQMGVVVNTDTQTLRATTRLIYSAYRFSRYNTIDIPMIVRVARWVRKRFVAALRSNRAPGPVVDVGHVTFLGVWDTVAAYGSPLAELTRGIDRFVFPLSMPDRTLNRKIRMARHALALDDERDTFHPLLWDELEVAEPERLKQVWFSGMHADVGGGYPDDAMSFHALAWMMDEAKAAGLEFVPHAHERFAPPPSRSALMHDSRKGLAGYYRYQPRRLSAYLLQPDPKTGTLQDDSETAVMRDPARKARAHVRAIKLHHSVLERIAHSTDRYAPIVMPAAFEVVDRAGRICPSGETVAAAQVRMSGQNAVWDLVWHKRVNYFLMVAASILFGLMPVWDALQGSGACQSFVCVLGPIISTVGGFLPGFLQYWIDAMADFPGVTIGFVVLLAALLIRSASLQRQIQDRMWQLWAPLRNRQVPVIQPARSWVHRLRTSPRYLAAVGWIKWQGLPCTLGLVALLTVILGVASLVAVPVLRAEISRLEASGKVCSLGAQSAPDPIFHTNMPCWKSPTPVLAGHTYEVRLTIEEPWLDQTLPADPHGVDSARYSYLLGFAGLPIRRTISGRWYQPFVTIVSPDETRHVQKLDFQNEGDIYVARFIPAQSGDVLLWVNDGVFGFGFSRRYYDNNHGSASVVIFEPAPHPAQ